MREPMHPARCTGSCENTFEKGADDMGLMEMSLESNLLGKTMNLSVYCPEGYERVKLPVLFFLHGRTGNEQLLQQLGMDKIADALIEAGEIKPLRIVCPNMDNSRGINSSDDYQEVVGKYDIVHKGRYEDYLVHEIIPFVDRSFPTIRDRCGRFIGGVSSGGYAALSIGLRQPELFSKIGGHMPAIDLSFEAEDECYFADQSMWLKYDPVTIAETVTRNDIKVFLDDGKDDEGQFYRACEKLDLILKQKGVDVQNHLFEGHHNKEYITSHLETYLRFYGGDPETMIKTKRLRLYPASQEQMEAMIASEQDEELKKAYTEMLDGCLRRPDQWDWYCIWMIEKTDGTHIGDLCFKGLQENGIAEIGYGILEEHQSQGYATEAVQAACCWAFRHEEVNSLEAETDTENAASQRVLEKCGFHPNGTYGEEGPRFTLGCPNDAAEGTR